MCYEKRVKNISYSLAMTRTIAYQSPKYLNPRSNKQTHMIMLLQKTYQPIVISDTLDTCYDQKHLASSLLMTSWQWASFICCCIASGHLEAPPIKANLFAIQRSVNFNLAHGHSIFDFTLVLWYVNLSQLTTNLSELVQTCPN